MKRRWIVCSILLNVVLLAAIFIAAAAPVTEQGGVAVRFSPDGGCADAVIEAIESSTRSLDIAVYHLTHAGIAKAIVNAHRRHVFVRVVMDASQTSAKYSAATFLQHAGVSVLVWQPGLMHNKFMIVDGKVVFTGSFNFTKAAEESNAENLVTIRDKPRIIAAYRQQFEQLIRQSGRYTPAAD